MASTNIVADIPGKTRLESNKLVAYAKEIWVRLNKKRQS